MSVKVKICGITNVEDGLAAAEAGADALGFIFYPQSPRYVSLEKAAAVIGKLPPMIVKVGVFVDASEEVIFRAIAECGLNLLQFHGAESPAFCLQFGLMSMKAFQVRYEQSLSRLAEFKTDAWLLDAYSADKLGGTGARFDWDLAIQAGKMGRPIFLAGGLTPENVATAVQHVQPYAVDVSSGVEASPGKKDSARVKAFIDAAKGALSWQERTPRS